MKLPALVKKCRQQMIDDGGGETDVYQNYMWEANRLQSIIDAAEQAMVIFSGRPEEDEAKIRLKKAQDEALDFRARIYVSYNRV